MVGAFNNLDTADDVAERIKAAMKDGDLSCQNIAIIRKHEDGKLKITEKGKIKKTHGAAVGAFLGGASVLLFGPVAVAAGALGGALAGATASVGARIGAAYGASAALSGTMVAQIAAMAGGAVAGGYTASKIETLDQDKLNKLGNLLQPSNSAIVAVFDQVLIPMDKFDAEMQESRDEILYKVGQEIADTLQKGEDVAFMVAFTDDKDVVTTRKATGDDAADIKHLVIKGETFDEGIVDSETEETISYEVIDGKVVDEGNEKQKS